MIGATDYRGLLRLYNRKSLPTQIGNPLGLKAGELVELVVRLARTDARIGPAALVDWLSRVGWRWRTSKQRVFRLSRVPMAVSTVGHS